MSVTLLANGISGRVASCRENGKRETSMIIERQGAIYILLCILWNIIHQYTLHHHLNIKYIHQQRFHLPPSKLPASGENNRSPASGKVGTIEMPWQLRLEMVGSDVEVIQLAFK